MYFLYRYKDKTAYYDSSGLYGERKKEVNRKKTIWILIVVLILDVIGIVFFFQMHRRTYSLDLPQAETLGNVVISTDTTKEEITDREKIKDLIYVLEGNGRTTKRESINDFPVNAETPIKIEFCFARGGSSVLYAYTQENRYYIEQPYNGIYQISGDEYNSVAKYVL